MITSTSETGSLSCGVQAVKPGERLPLEPDPGTAEARSAPKLTIHPEQVLLSLCAATALLVTVGTSCRLVIYYLAPDFDLAPQAAPRITRLLARFDLGFEPSVPAWYSSLGLFAAAAVLTVIGVLHRNRGEPCRLWLLLAAVFCGLSLDEMVMFHETLSETVRNRMGTGGALYFAWVIPAGVFVLGLGMLYCRFLLRLPTRTRVLFAAAGVTFVGGAIGVEMLEGILFVHGQLASPLFTFVQALEEGMEMIGVAVFLYALLDYLRHQFGMLTFNWTFPPAPGDIR